MLMNRSYTCLFSEQYSAEDGGDGERDGEDTREVLINDLDHSAETHKREGDGDNREGKGTTISLKLLQIHLKKRMGMVTKARVKHIIMYSSS